MKVLCAYGTRKSKPRVKSELCKQQYTVTLFDCNHLTPVIVLWQMQKFICHCTSFCFAWCLIWGQFPSTGPGGLHWRGDLTEGFLRYKFGGLYLEGLIFWILRYLPQRVFHSNNLPNEKRYSPTLTPFLSRRGKSECGLLLLSLFPSV